MSALLGMVGRARLSAQLRNLENEAAIVEAELEMAWHVIKKFWLSSSFGMLILS